MKLLDYYLEKMNIQITRDEYGNLYIEGGWEVDDLVDICHSRVLTYADDYYFMTREAYDRLNQFEILIDRSIDQKKMEEWFGREPFYRLGGKPVTEEQAFDIIRRTDRFFGEIPEIYHHEDYVCSIYFDNCWIYSPEKFARSGGWAYRDGMIGHDGILYKNPSLKAIIKDWAKNLIAFPYLDLAIAITGSKWEWEVEKIIRKLEQQHIRGDRSRWEIKKSEDCDEAFYASVYWGIWVHDKTLEVLTSGDALAVYKKYASLYKKYKVRETKDEEAVPLDLPYLRRCIQAYGMDADKVLSQKNFRI